MAYTDFDWVTETVAVGGSVELPVIQRFDGFISLQTHAPVELGPWIKQSDVPYLWFPIRDRRVEEPHPAVVGRFTRAAEQIARWEREGRHILVHCGSGVSRSPSAVIWHLMLAEQMAWDSAFQRVKAARVQTLPNVVFEIALRTAAGERLSDETVRRRVLTFCTDLAALHGITLTEHEIDERLAQAREAALLDTRV